MVDFQYKDLYDVKDLEEIVAEGKPINLECQFCDQVYTFTPEEISDLLKEI